MSRMSQYFYDLTNDQAEDAPTNEQSQPPEYQSELDRISVLNQAFNKIFGGNAPLPF